MSKKNFIISNCQYKTLYQNNIRLYSPVPGVSTHVHKDFLSPGIDWCDLHNLIRK